MKNLACRLLVVALLVPTAVHAPVALGEYGRLQQLRASSVEIAQLPKFCWAQMEVPGATGGEYTFHNCGAWTNHYCEGLLFLLRAKTEPNKGRRATLLTQADEAIRYTEEGIKNHPQCSVKGHVAASKAEVNTLLGIYGKKKPLSPAPSR